MSEQLKPCTCGECKYGISNGNELILCCKRLVLAHKTSRCSYGELKESEVAD